METKYITVMPTPEDVSAIDLARVGMLAAQNVTGPVVVPLPAGQFLVSPPGTLSARAQVEFEQAIRGVVRKMMLEDSYTLAWPGPKPSWHDVLDAVWDPMIGGIQFQIKDTNYEGSVPTGS